MHKKSKHSEMQGPVRQIQIQRPVKLFKKLYHYIMLHSTGTTYLSSTVLLISPLTPDQHTTLMWPRKSQNCLLQLRKLFSSTRCEVVLWHRPGVNIGDIGTCPVFTARAMLALRCISYSNSVCLSVRLSVRHTPVLCQNDGT